MSKNNRLTVIHPDGTIDQLAGVVAIVAGDEILRAMEED
jgi:hypothetical protein